MSCARTMSCQRSSSQGDLFTEKFELEKFFTKKYMCLCEGAGGTFFTVKNEQGKLFKEVGRGG